MAVVHYYW